MSMVRSLAGSLVRPLAAAIVGSGSGDLTSALQAFYTPQGGSLTGAMLDPGASGAVWSNTAGTIPADAASDNVARIDDLSGLGNNATQGSAPDQPTLASNPWGRLILNSGGGSVHMDLPDGALGDGAEAICATFAVAFDAANSDANGRLLSGASGAGVEVYLASGVLTFTVHDGGSANSETISYARAMTDHETVVASLTWAPSGPPRIRINGKVVAEGSSAYTTLDDPGAGEILGVGAATNLAGTLSRAGVLVGTGATATDARTAAEDWCAEAADPVPWLRQTPLQKLMRNFVPATDLNYTADWSSGLDGFTDASSGTASASVSGGQLVLQGDGTNQGRAQIIRRVRAGRRYTFSLPNDAASVGTVRVDYFNDPTAGSSLGSSLAAAGNTASITVTATSSYARFFLAGKTSAVSPVLLDSAEFEEIPATGTFWNLVDESKRFSDAGSTQAGANDQVQRVTSEYGSFNLNQTTLAERATIDATGAVMVFDGSGDNYVADNGDELAFAGDMTIISAVEASSLSAAGTIASAGDSTVATDTAYQFGYSATSGQLFLEQADAANSETETCSACALVVDTAAVVSVVRDGATATFAKDITTIEAETFSTVTSPTSGTSPGAFVGIKVDESSEPLNGILRAEIRIGHALSTGLHVLCEGAITDLTA